MMQTRSEKSPARVAPVLQVCGFAVMVIAYFWFAQADSVETTTLPMVVAAGGLLLSLGASFWSGRPTRRKRG